MRKHIDATLTRRFRVFLPVWLICFTGIVHRVEALPCDSHPVPALEEAARAAENMPRLHSLLVSRRGEVILECYYNGKSPTSPSNIKSVSKSVISAAVGIAIQHGHLGGVGQPIGSFFSDELGNDDDAPKREITLEDLLTMRSGLESTSNRNYGAWVQSRNWVQYALDRPMLNPPGRIMQYSTGNTHLLSAILTASTGASTWQFLQENIAKPLGFQLARWQRDPQGIYFGGNNMLMTPRQMIAFGELYLNGGRANGRQIIPSSWVEASLVPRARSLRERGRFYGYGWWMREMSGYETVYAWGFGGQYIFLFPDLDLVVVSTASASVSNDRRSHRRAIFDIVERLILGNLSSAPERESPVARSDQGSGWEAF